LESVVEKEAGLKTPWMRFTLDEFAEHLKRDLATYHDDEASAGEADVTMAPEEAFAAPVEAPAPMDVVMAPVEAPAGEISDAQASLKARFAAAKLVAIFRRAVGGPRHP